MNKTTKIIIWVVVAVVVVAGIWYGVSRKPAPVAEKEPVKIGVIYPLTGAGSYFGKLKKEGAELAVNEINQKGGLLGKKVELIVEDSKTDVKEGLSAFNKLVEIEKTPIIISSLSSVCMAIKPNLKEKNVILFANVGHPEITKDNENKNIFRNFPTAGAETKKMASFIFNKNISKIAIVSLNDDWGRSLSETLKIHLNNKVDIVSEEFFDSATTDFRSILAKVLSKRPEAIYFAGYGGNSRAIFAKQLKEFRFDGYFLGPIGVDDTFLKVSWDVAEGHIFTDIYFDLNRTTTRLFFEH